MEQILHNTLLTAPWYISISFSPKYGICLKGFTEINTDPIYVCVQKQLRFIE